MLSRFIAEHRGALIERTRAKVRSRLAPLATHEELETGVPLFLTQFVRGLESVTGFDGSAIGAAARLHGTDLLKRGFTISQVVHDYGDICQAVTELAVEKGEPITNDDFHALNLCLDDAIAAAVTAWSDQLTKNLSDQEVERLGVLAHELRNLVSTATIAFHVLQTGTVGIGGNTGAVLGRSLTGLRDLIERSLAEVRLSTGLLNPVRVVVRELLNELEVAASLDPRTRGLKLAVAPLGPGIAVHADRHVLASALWNLLQNALKFTVKDGSVAVRARSSEGRVLIDIADECGGLGPEKAAALFRPFARGESDRTGLGLGLAITARAVQASGGSVRVEDLPGKGCVFTVELPQVP